jgi:hypothetical protein
VRNLIYFIKSLSLKKYFFILAVIGYMPIIIFGYFIQDDYTIISLTDLKFFDAVKDICGVNNNRPLSCVYHAFLTRLFPNFQIYFLLSLFLYFLFIYLVFKIYDFILNDKYIKKIFLTLLIFPFFSYTVIYSPGMQSMGIISLIFWALSLFFLKRYIYKSFLKDLFISHFFLIMMFLIYESAMPLLGISLFFPLFFKNKKKIFFINIIFTILILIFVVAAQKKIFPYLFDADLSRIKLGIQDYKKIIFLVIINLALSANIFLHSIELFFRSLYNIIHNLNFILLLQLVLITLFYFISTQNKKKIRKKNYYFLGICSISLISVFFLNALMHSVANTGLEFTQYNNRALVSISFIFALFVVFFCRFGLINSKFLYNFFYIKIFLIFLVNFFFFQNNLIRERFLAEKLLLDTKELTVQKTKNSINFFIYDRPDVEQILSYNTLDYFRIIEEKDSKNTNIFLNEFKFCNLDYYNHYIKIPLLKKNHKLNIFYYTDKKLRKLSENVSSENFRENVEKIINCNYKVISEESSLKIEKNVYLDKRFESIFLKFIKNIYFNL